MEQVPEHNVTLPFIRMAAGPMDYTPGAVINHQPDTFRSMMRCPMSMGTRCHQLAMYVVYESPLQMMCDSPTHYLREAECTQFISAMPTVWDETVVLAAKVADYIILARRSGRHWYMAAMTDGNEREFTIALSFLDKGQSYRAEIFQDGINALRNGNDYQRVQKTVSGTDSLTLKLAPGGGWAAIFRAQD
jgi:alpha-glucosidase